MDQIREFFDVRTLEPNLKEVGEAIFAYFSAVGIRCKIVGVEYAAWLNLIRRWPEGSTQKAPSSRRSAWRPSVTSSDRKSVV